jgi:hypothetical protein
MIKLFRFALILVTLSLCATSLSAQGLTPVRMVTGNFFRLGIKGGVNLTELKTEGLT